MPSKPARATAAKKTKQGKEEDVQAGGSGSVAPTKPKQARPPIPRPSITDEDIDPEQQQQLPFRHWERRLGRSPALSGLDTKYPVYGAPGEDNIKRAMEHNPRYVFVVSDKEGKPLDSWESLIEYIGYESNSVQLQQWVYNSSEGPGMILAESWDYLNPMLDRFSLLPAKVKPVFDAVYFPDANKGTKVLNQGESLDEFMALKLSDLGKYEDRNRMIMWLIKHLQRHYPQYFKHDDLATISKAVGTITSFHQLDTTAEDAYRAFCFIKRFTRKNVQKVTQAVAKDDQNLDLYSLMTQYNEYKQQEQAKEQNDNEDAPVEDVPKEDAPINGEASATYLEAMSSNLDTDHEFNFKMVTGTRVSPKSWPKWQWFYIDLHCIEKLMTPTNKATAPTGDYDRNALFKEPNGGAMMAFLQASRSTTDSGDNPTNRDDWKSERFLKLIARDSHYIHDLQKRLSENIGKFRTKLPAFTSDPRLQGRFQRVPDRKEVKRRLETCMARFDDSWLKHPSTIAELVKRCERHDYAPEHLRHVKGDAPATVKEKKRQIRTHMEAIAVKATEYARRLVLNPDFDGDGFEFSEDDNPADIVTFASGIAERLKQTSYCAPINPLTKSLLNQNIDANGSFPPKNLRRHMPVGFANWEIQLRNHQINGMEWLTFMLTGEHGLCAGFLCDEPGLGKTILTIATHMAIDLLEIEAAESQKRPPKIFPKLILMPSGTIPSWIEAMDFFKPLACHWMVANEDLNASLRTTIAGNGGSQVQTLEDFTLLMDKCSNDPVLSQTTYVLAKMDTFSKKTLTTVDWAPNLMSKEGREVQKYHLKRILNRLYGDMGGEASIDGEGKVRISDDLMADLTESRGTEEELGADADVIGGDGERMMGSTAGTRAGTKPTDATHRKAAKDLTEASLKYSRVRHIECRIIIDESHHYRGVYSNRSLSVLDLINAKSITLMSGTPLYNKVDDIRQIMPYFLRPDPNSGIEYDDSDLQAPPAKPATELQATKADYEQLAKTIECAKSEGRMLTNEEIKQNKFLLNGRRLRSVLAGDRSQGELSVDSAYRVMRPVVEFICLHRSSSDQMIGAGGETLQCGAGIAPLLPMTIEVKYPDGMDGRYRQANEGIYRIANTKRAFRHIDQPGRKHRSRNMILDPTVVRLFSLSALDPTIVHTDLDATMEASLNHLMSSLDGPEDGRIDTYDAMYLQRFPHGPKTPPTVRWDFVRMQLEESPKFMVLAKIIQQIILTQGEKLIITTHYPATQWLVEDWLVALGLNFGIIRAEQNLHERLTVIEEFNKADSTLDGLLLPDRIGGQSLNLQNGGAALVMLDVVPSDPQRAQVAGRQHRDGQTVAVRAFFITQDRSIDQYLRHMSTTKARAIIAVTMNVEELDKEVNDLYQQKLATIVAEKWTDATIAAWKQKAKRSVRDLRATQLVVDQNGARSSAKGISWACVTNFSLKDELPGEVNCKDGQDASSVYTKTISDLLKLEPSSFVDDAKDDASAAGTPRAKGKGKGKAPATPRQKKSAKRYKSAETVDPEDDNSDADDLVEKNADNGVYERHVQQRHAEKSMINARQSELTGNMPFHNRDRHLTDGSDDDNGEEASAIHASSTPTFNPIPRRSAPTHASSGVRSDKPGSDDENEDALSHVVTPPGTDPFDVAATASDGAVVPPTPVGARGKRRMSQSAVTDNGNSPTGDDEGDPAALQKTKSGRPAKRRRARQTEGDRLKADIANLPLPRARR